MQTRAQSKAFGAGTVAAMDRDKDLVKTIIEIDHAPNVPGQSLLKGIAHWLAASGAVNMQHTRVTLGDAELQEALSFSEKARTELKRKLDEAQEQLAMLKQGTAGYVSLTKAAQMHGVNYSTMWRAKQTGRLKVVVIGGKQKDQMLCDPTTYVPAIDKLKKKK